MTGFEIAGLIAMLAGAATQYKASTDASKRAENETLRALYRQDELDQAAEKRVMQKAQEFTPDQRKTQESEIATDLGEQYFAPVKSAQEINSAQSTTQGDVSSDYVTAKATSDARQLKMASDLARLLGKTTAARRLRTNEAIGMADTAGDIDRIGRFARGNADADDVAIRAAARPNAGMWFGGSILGSLGGAGLMQGSASAQGAAHGLSEATPLYANGWDAGMGAVNNIFGTSKNVGLDLGAFAPSIKASGGASSWSGPLGGGVFTGVGGFHR